MRNAIATNISNPNPSTRATRRANFRSCWAISFTVERRVLVTHHRKFIAGLRSLVSNRGGRRAHTKLSDLFIWPSITPQHLENSHEATLSTMVRQSSIDKPMVYSNFGPERVDARCFGTDLKRKLLTRLLITAFHQAGQEQRIFQVTGLSHFLVHQKWLLITT